MSLTHIIMKEGLENATLTGYSEGKTNMRQSVTNLMCLCERMEERGHLMRNIKKRNKKKTIDRLPGCRSSIGRTRSRNSRCAYGLKKDKGKILTADNLGFYQKTPPVPI